MGGEMTGGKVKGYGVRVPGAEPPEPEDPCKGKIQKLENQIGLLYPAMGYDHRVNSAVRKITEALVEVLKCHEELPT
jgi:hypothetical protein